MKLTVKQLRKLIKEEVNNSIKSDLLRKTRYSLGEIALYWKNSVSVTNNQKEKIIMKSIFDKLNSLIKKVDSGIIPDATEIRALGDNIFQLSIGPTYQERRESVWAMNKASAELNGLYAEFY